MEVDRLFLDANVLFSAAYRPEAGLRRLWELTDVELITSAYAVEEARRNLETPAQRTSLNELLDAVKILAVSPGTLSLPLAIDLPENDRPILAAAIGARSTHLVTGDVKAFGKYYGQMVEGVLILPLAVYLRECTGGFQTRP